MKKTTALLFAALLAACAPADQEGAQEGALRGSLDPAALHERLLVVDSHIDIPINYMSEVDPAGDDRLQADLPKLEAGQIDAAFLIIYTPQGGETEADFAKAAEIADMRIRAIEAMLSQYAGRAALAISAEQVRQINRSGRLAILLGIENAYPLAGNIASIHDWAARGVRYVGITHFGHNHFADSSNPHDKRDQDQPRHDGLSEQGRVLIAALNEAGIMVDVSHASKSTMMQAADLSTTPIIASHSGAKAIGDNPRNLDDEQLRKIAEVGGVAQMVAFDGYVKPFTPEQTAFRNALREDMGLQTWPQRRDAPKAIRDEYERRLLGMWEIEPRASVADFAGHIDHAVSVAGIDHVGIASDFDGGGGLAGWEDASKTSNVTAELVRRGYSETDIEKLWGGNLLRVMDAAGAGAKKRP